MKERFEKNLNTYNDAIKESFKDMSKGGKARCLEVKESLTESFAKESHTSKDAELEIFAIQKQKLERLNKFKKFLEKTRNSNGGFEHATMNKEGEQKGIVLYRGGDFFVRGKDNIEQPIQLSEIMTDGEWGLSYSFDDSVNIHDIRAYYLQSLKSDLREKLDAQIIISESNNSWVDTRKQEAYREIAKRQEGNKQEGVIAEKMVKNFLKKLAIENSFDFDIVDADVYQDVEQKIDFIIHRKNVDKKRGARVEEVEGGQDIGVQFTTALGKTEQKEKQIEKSRKNLEEDIDDIVLVSVPSYQASEIFEKWNKTKDSGGPDKLWSQKVKETLFRGVMDKILSQEEIDSFCEKNFK